jgi:hypothetical protein
MIELIADVYTEAVQTMDGSWLYTVFGKAYQVSNSYVTKLLIIA